MAVENINFNWMEELMKDISNCKIEEIVGKWWENYFHDSKGSNSVLCLFLINSAGLDFVLVNIEDLYSASPSSDIFSKTARISEPPIMNKSYCKKFTTLIDCILKEDSWKIFDNMIVIGPILDFIKLLRQSPWNSIRAVAYITGLRIMTQAWRCYYYLRHSTGLVMHERTKIANEIWEIIFKGIFVFNFRDTDNLLRTLPLLELTKWFHENREILMKNMFFKYIKRSLSDRTLSNRRVTIELIHRIFLEPIIVKQQKILFDVIKPDLINLLPNRDAKVPLYCLKIINAASRIFKVNLSNNELKSVFMTVYSRRKLIISEVKYFINNIYLKNEWNVSSIFKIVKIYCSCPVKSAQIFMEHFFEYFVSNISWRDWEEILKSCSDENFYDCLALFHEVIRIRIECKPDLQEVPEWLSDYNLNESFTIELSTIWLNILSQEKKCLSKDCWVIFLKITQYFNGSDLPDHVKEQLLKVAFREFLNQKEYIVLKEWSRIFSFLDIIYKYEARSFATNFISAFIENALQHMKAQHSTAQSLSLATFKTVLLLKTYYFDTDPLWQGLMSLLEVCVDPQKNEDIVIVLYNILMNDRRYYIECHMNKETEPSALLKKRESILLVLLRLRNRFYILVNILSLILKQNDSLSLSYTASKLFGKLINNFGEHLSEDSILSKLNFEIKFEEIILYVTYCSSYMLIDCPQPRNACCSTLKTFVNLLNERKINMSYLKYFIQHIGKVHQHSVILLHILNHFIKNPIGATPIINGFIIFFNKMKSNVPLDTLKIQLQDMAEFIIHNKPISRSEYQLLGVHLYLFVEHLINQGYTVFSGVLKALENSLLDEVLQKLLEK